MYFKKIFFLSLFAFCLAQAQNNIAINVNDEDLEIATSLNINAMDEYSQSTSYVLDASYLHTDGNDLSSIGISGENNFQGVDGLALAFGAKFVFTDDFIALPLFTKIVYTLPFDNSIPTTSLNTSLAYAPSVLSFSDAESYLEFRLEADMEIISNIHIYTGYRNIDTDYEKYDQNFNDSFYAGMKLSF